VAVSISHQLAVADDFEQCHVAFWNIQWFPGQRPDAILGEQKHQIDAVHADIARLNAETSLEWKKCAISPKQGSQSSRSLDVCANFPPREGQSVAQEVAIASRLQPLSAWAEEWQAAGVITPSCGFAFAAYEVKPDELLMVYAVHLKSNRGNSRQDISMRQESIQQLQSDMEAMQTAFGRLGIITWIVRGDFNISLDGKQFARETSLRSMIDKGFGWIWRDIAAASRITLPPANGFSATCFDHIFYRSATLRKAWGANTSRRSSDHRAIVAIFDLHRAAKYRLATKICPGSGYRRDREPVLVCNGPLARHR
jgi:endonuclease/exonuclease/phosphatase (EEP) superfamily protein YafD